MFNKYYSEFNCAIKILLVAATAVGAVLLLSGCMVQVGRKQRPLVKFEQLKGKLELSMEKQTDEFESSGSKQKNISSIYEEELYFDVQGNVFHPKLMSFLASLGLGLSQQNFKSDEAEDSFSGNFTSYGLNMNFLPMKPYPFGISLSKSENFVPRRFRSPLRVVNSTSSFSTNLRVPDWPMTFSWSSSETKQKSDLAADDDDLFAMSSDRWSYSLRHDFSERSHLAFRLDWDQIQQEGRGSSREIDTKRHRLEHDLNFGSEGQHQLSSTVSFVDKSGTYTSKTIDINESLVLNHSETFLTFYNATLSKNTFDSTTNQTSSGTAGFNHRLYKNLITSLDVFATSSDFETDTETTRKGGHLRFDYTRNNPWGQIISSYSVDMESEKRTGEDGTGFIIDETHIFNDPFNVTLKKRDIVVSSIVVTNSTGSEIYTEGDDYTILVIDDQVQLDITPIGEDIPNITDGQLLLVDYLYQAEGLREEDSLGQTFRIKQEFDNGLSIFYSHKRRSEQVDFPFDTEVIPNEYKNNTYGVSYKKNNILLRAEQSRTMSSRNPVKSTRLIGNGVWPITSRTNFSTRVSQSWVEATREKLRETTLFKAEGEIKTRLSRRLKLSGTTEWRDEDDTDNESTKGLRMGVALGYDYRLSSIKVGWNSYSLDRRNTQTDNSNYYINLVRRF